MRKVSLQRLLQIQNDLDSSLAQGDIDVRTYNREWDEILTASGWTDEEYANEIDRRWDYILNEPRASSLTKPS